MPKRKWAEEEFLFYVCLRFLKNPGIEHVGRDDLKRDADLPKVHQLRESESSFLSLNCKSRKSQ